jgi:hypothetical protein
MTVKEKWGVLCICEVATEDEGYHESIYGEYDSWDEAMAAMDAAYEYDQVQREDDPTRPESYSFDVLTPDQLEDWYATPEAC